MVISGSNILSPRDGSSHRPQLVRVMWGLLACWALPACGGDGPATQRADIELAANAATSTTLALESGVALDIPAGASSVALTIVLQTEPGSRRAGTVGTIVSTPLTLGPEGAMFDKDLELTIPITASSLPDGSTLDDVVVITAPHGSNVFVPLPTHRSGNAVVAVTTHFSDFVAIVPTTTFDAGIDSGIDAGVADGGPSFDASIVDAGLDAEVDAGPLDSGVDSGPIDSGIDAGPAYPAPNGMLHVFLTQTSPNGNLGGPVGADAVCMSDPRRRTSGIFKAMIVTSTRSVCASANCSGGATPLDWVFAPNTAYYAGVTGAETPFTTTDANGLIVFPLGSILGVGMNFWLGMNADWTASSLNCGDFGDASGTVFAAVGWDPSQTSGFLAGGMVACNGSIRLLCVEQ
jgi:hypothetical protein